MKKIKLSRGKTALIDDDDFERVSQYNWYINENAEKTKLYAMRSKLKSEEVFQPKCANGWKKICTPVI